MLGEYAPTERRGLISSVIALGSNSGTLLASLVWLLVVQMDQQSLLEWGWRIPFLSSALIALVALWIRRHLRETPVFERRKAEMEAERAGVLAAPVVDQRPFFQRTRAFWTMVGLRIGENGPSYLAQGFIVGYVAKVLMVDKSVPTTAVFLASLLGFLIIPLAGWLSDRFGRRVVYRVFCLLLMFYAWPAFTLLDTREPMLVIPVIVVGMALASLGILVCRRHGAWRCSAFIIATPKWQWLKNWVPFCPAEPHHLLPLLCFLIPVTGGRLRFISRRWPQLGSLPPLSRLKREGGISICLKMPSSFA